MPSDTVECLHTVLGVKWSYAIRILQRACTRCHVVPRAPNSPSSPSPSATLAQAQTPAPPKNHRNCNLRCSATNPCPSYGLAYASPPCTSTAGQATRSLWRSSSGHVPCADGSAALRSSTHTAPSHSPCLCALRKPGLRCQMAPLLEFAEWLLQSSLCALEYARMSEYEHLAHLLLEHCTSLELFVLPSRAAADYTRSAPRTSGRRRASTFKPRLLPSLGQVLFASNGRSALEKVVDADRKRTAPCRAATPVLAEGEHRPRLLGLPIARAMQDAEPVVVRDIHTSHSHIPRLYHRSLHFRYATHRHPHTAPAFYCPRYSRRSLITTCSAQLQSSPHAIPQIARSRSPASPRPVAGCQWATADGERDFPRADSVGAIGKSEACSRRASKSRS